MRSNQKKLSRSARSVTLKGDSSTLITSEVRALRQTLLFPEQRNAVPHEELPFRQVLENFSEVFWMASLDRRRILYVSPSYEQIWGRSCQSLYESPQSWFEAVHPDDLARVINAVSGTHERSYDLEYRIARGDGAVRWIRERAFLVRDSAGAPYCMAGFAEDITARKESEHALCESEQRYRQLVELCPDAIYIRHGFQFTFVNSAAVRLFGVENADDLVGRSLLDFLSKGYVRIISERSRDIVRSGESSGMTHLKILRPDGATRDIEVISAPIDTASGVAILSVMRDITDRKQLEREILHAVEREQERIGQDLHDGLCQLLVATKYRVAMLERMLNRESCNREAFGIEHMLNEAIDLSRGLARGLNPVKLSGNGLVHALEELASNTQASRLVRCAFRCPVPITLPSHAVANHLYRIAQESVQNAMKHGHASKISISLRTAGNRLMLTVKDDGAGLPQRAEEIEGAGLNNMKTRAAMIGAILKISRRRGGGTAVACTFNPALTRNHANAVQ